ncbi:hypothetical protein ACFWSJ_08755 [Streptomyces niveus]|uniref:hypothetical protein n=1 Tax=Streptomyces niveus TaxID=193462 RepID=UPI003664F309
MHARMISTVVDISEVCDNRGITKSGADESDGFNIWRNTFPAEDLPAPGSAVEVTGVAFEFPARATGRGDNIRCRGQLLPLPGVRADWLYLLGAAERRTEDEVELHYADGAVRTAWLRMSDFWPETAAWFGEPEAFRGSGLRYPRHTQDGHRPAIWQQRIPVTVPGELTALRLPDNPAMHVFALTAVLEPGVRDAS